MPTVPALASTTVDDLLRRAPRTAPILNRLGIDTCCGGGLSLDQAARSAGLELRELLAELQPTLEAE